MRVIHPVSNWVIFYWQMKRNRNPDVEESYWTSFIPEHPDLLFAVCRIVYGPHLYPNTVAIRNNILLWCDCEVTIRTRATGSVVLLPWDQVTTHGYKVMNTLLREGHCIETNTWHQVIVQPEDTNEPLTPDVLEGIYVKKANQVAVHMESIAFVTFIEMHPVFRYLSLWKTADGKRFIRSMHHRARATYPRMYRDRRIWLIEYHVPLDRDLRSGSEEIEEKNNATNDSDDARKKMCLICEERPPNTMVLPCEHTVVCAECSDAFQKRGSLASNKCLQCQRPFDEIIPFEIQ